MTLRPSIVMALAAFALAPLAHAGSLGNGDFHVDLAHWTTFVATNVSATRVAEDAQGQAGSGAAELRDTAPGSGGTQVVLSQCVNLTGASFPVPYAAKAKVAIEGEPGVKAYLLVAEHNAPDCPLGSYIGASRSHIVNDSQANWQSFSGNFTPFDGSVQAVIVKLAIEKSVGSGAGGAVRFDAIQFGVPGPELTRWTIDSGGGYLTGGNYVLHGTVGQPDPGSASAGGTTLQSGFWFGESVPPTDAVFKDSFE